MIEPGSVNDKVLGVKGFPELCFILQTSRNMAVVWLTRTQTFEENKRTSLIPTNLS